MKGTTNVLSYFFSSDPQQVGVLFLMQPNSLLSLHRHMGTQKEKLGRPWYRGTACNALSIGAAFTNRSVTFGLKGKNKWEIIFFNLKKIFKVIFCICCICHMFHSPPEPMVMT